jgi:hypothetical protein
MRHTVGLVLGTIFTVVVSMAGCTSEPAHRHTEETHYCTDEMHDVRHIHRLDWDPGHVLRDHQEWGWVLVNYTAVYKADDTAVFGCNVPGWA